MKNISIRPDGVVPTEEHLPVYADHLSVLFVKENFSLYIFNADSWQKLGSLKGEKGDPGYSSIIFCQNKVPIGKRGDTWLW